MFDDVLIEHIDDVRPYLREGMRVMDRDGYSVIDYTFAGSGTFPDRLSLECRGLKFDQNGNLIARPLHKFFNVGERQSVDQIDWQAPHRVYEKLDGSMVHGCLLDGNLAFMTRGGVSPQARMAFERSSRKHRDLAMHYLEDGFTPVFEFTSPDNRIVVPYDNDALTLLAVRQNQTGRYLRHDLIAQISSDFGVTLAESFDPVDDPERFIAMARSITGAEGFIIAFDSGHRLKIKGEEYAFRHKALATMASEKNVLRLVLDKQEDDILPNLAPAISDRLKTFRSEVHATVSKSTEQVEAFIEDNRHLDRKDFALKAREQLPPQIMSAAFAGLDGKSVPETISAVLRRATGSRAKMEEARSVFDVSWSLDDIPLHELQS